MLLTPAGTTSKAAVLGAEYKGSLFAISFCWLCQNALYKQNHVRVSSCTHSAHTHVYTCSHTHTSIFWHKPTPKYNSSSQFGTTLLFPKYSAWVWMSRSFSFLSLPDPHESCIFRVLFPPVTQMSEELRWGPGWCPLLLLHTLSWLCSLASSSSSLSASCRCFGIKWLRRELQRMRLTQM